MSLGVLGGYNQQAVNPLVGEPGVHLPEKILGVHLRPFSNHFFSLQRNMQWLQTLLPQNLPRVLQAIMAIGLIGNLIDLMTPPPKPPSQPQEKSE